MSRPDHHAPPNAGSPNLVPIDIFRSVGEVAYTFLPLLSNLAQPNPNFSTWRIGHSGGDVATSNLSISFLFLFLVLLSFITDI